MKTITKHSKKKSHSYEKMPFGLMTISVALAFIPLCFESSFTFQSIFYLMAFVLVHGLIKNITLRKSSVGLLACFAGLTAMGYLYSLIISPEIISSTSLVRVFLFLGIVLTYASVVAPDYSPCVVSRALRLTALTSIASCALVFARFVSMGFYFGRIYPITLLGVEMDANYYAIILVLQAGISLLVALYESHAIKKCLYFALFSFCCLAIMLTGSRSGVLCVCISCLIQVFIYFKQHANTKLLTTVLIVLLMLGIVVLASRFVSDWLLDRFFKQSYNDDSNQFRILLWGNAIKRVMGRPIFGFGIGNYTYYSAQDWGLESVSNAAHGTFFDYLVDFGFVGLAAFCSMFFAPIKRLVKCKGIPFLGIAVSFFIAVFIIGAERTVALWVFIIEFDAISRVMERTGISTFELVNSISPVIEDDVDAWLSDSATASRPKLDFSRLQRALKTRSL